MDNDTTFRTKTGYCHVLPDKIVLTRDGALGDLSKVVSGNNITRTLLIYGVLGLYFIYIAFRDFQEGKVLFAALYMGFAAFLTYGIINSINNSGKPIINRTTIQKVEFTPAAKWLTRAYFTVFFEENGKFRKRLIMLPGTLSGGDDEAPQALAIMKREGLIEG